MKWITDGSKPEEKRKVLFIVGNNDVRLGKFLKKDQWERSNMFCDGSFFNIEQVVKWAYVNIDESATPEIETLKRENDRLKEELEGSKWISVEDRLPEFGERVLVYIEDSGSYFVAWVNKENRWHIATGQSILGVTHWQPLPASPDTKK